MLFSALIAAAGFLLGARVGLAIGQRSERGRRILAERRWLSELAQALGTKRGEVESVEATRERLLVAARERHVET